MSKKKNKKNKTITIFPSLLFIDNLPLLPLPGYRKPTTVLIKDCDLMIDPLKPLDFKY